MPKQKISQDITDAKDILKDVMQSNLSRIADLIIQQTMREYRRLPASQKLKATKAITDVGVTLYKKELLIAMSIIAEDALKKVRKEVPKAKLVQLAEPLDHFKLLPPKVRTRIKSQADNLVDIQKNDLDKSIVLQFSSSVVSTDSESTIEFDMSEAAEKLIAGNVINGGADVTAGMTINETRDAFLTDEEVQAQLDAYIFMNDDPVTELCQELSNNGEGRVFGLDDPGAQEFTPPLHFNALVDGQMISTIGGLMKIEDIKLSEFVKTHTGKFQKVTEVMSKFEDKEYLEIELEDGKIIKITGEHPVYSENKWVRADELKLGDDVVTLEDIDNEIPIV